MSGRIDHQGVKRTSQLLLNIGGSLLLLAALSGCGDSGQSINTSTGENQSSLTPYTGVQPFNVFGGLWEMQLDHKTNYFNLNNVDYTYGPQSFVGNFQTQSSGFLNLNVTSSQVPLNGNNVGDHTGPFVIEHPGDGALMETNGSVPPVILAANSSCPTLNNQSYQFIELGGAASYNPANQGYGRVTVSTTGTSWIFSNYDILGMDGTDQKPAALGSATCAQAAEGYVATMPVTLNGAALTYTVAVSSSGLFMMDRDWHGNQLPLAGMVVPANPLGVSALQQAEYIGYEYDFFHLSPQGLAEVTVPVYFAPGLEGGSYPSSDVTQTPGNDVSIELGTEDLKNNGFYPSVTVTMPDNLKRCQNQSFGGTSAAGKPVCIFPGVAVAGNGSGKYDLFVSVLNLGDQQQQIAGGHSVIQFLLFAK